jgi:NADPH:quinone reductase-like Zn-dependent oxidoreductase
MSAETMRAIRFERYGGPDVLELGRAPVPVPGRRDVLVEVRAAAVNPVDCKFRAGTHRAVIRKTLPVTPGMDLSGVVRAVGAGVTDFRVGDAVFASPHHRRMGAYAELALVAERELAHKPERLDHVEAASLPLAALTAWDALVRHGRVQPGERVLIQAGAGGVGSIAIQLAKHLGAEVSTTASAANHELVRSLGADLAIDHHRERYEVAARGSDLVIDSLGPQHWRRALECVRPGGRIVALTTGLPDAVARRGPWLGLALAAAEIVLFTLRARVTRGVRFVAMAREPNGATLAKIARLVDTGAIRPVLDSVLPLSEAAEAHRRVETGRSRGKVVLSCG